MKPKILVIEDERAIYDNISYAFNTDGIDTEWSSTGADSLKKLKNENFQLLILDIGLPDINGIELCKKIRSFTNIPIVFLSARTDVVDKIVGLEIGGDDYVTKPFSPRELVARVKAILRRTEKKNEELENKFPFKIDEKKQIISYFNQSLALSRYEYKLMKVLIGKPGWTFSREQLMDQAWDQKDVSVDRTIDTHIKTIRAKLKKINAEIDPILTRRGLGYSIKETW
jgi:two-component system catabolic regulation response regulator CreB